MKKIFSISFVILFFVTLFFSCSSKQTPVDRLEDLVEELQSESEDYTTEDWEDFAQKYAKIEEDLQQYDYTDEELKEIGKLKAKCFRAITKSSAKIMKSKMHDIKMQLEGASEEIEDALGDFKDIFEEFEE